MFLLSADIVGDSVGTSLFRVASSEVQLRLKLHPQNHDKDIHQYKKAKTLTQPPPYILAIRRGCMSALTLNIPQAGTPPHSCTSSSWRQKHGNFPFH
ncbi:hypothetical protein CDAR_584661 [Caerostris darwini]|uniref:Uncharacterized protein n=1 Tax=Caerostris darwini TaxID=1538125 RepID=A0AAV4PYL4_9ARAC|nr:hypothetical protein CDAR_584661 [Caerostris darwini]